MPKTADAVSRSSHRRELALATDATIPDARSTCCVPIVSPSFGFALRAERPPASLGAWRSRSFAESRSVIWSKYLKPPRGRPGFPASRLNQNSADSGILDTAKMRRALAGVVAMQGRPSSAGVMALASIAAEWPAGYTRAGGADISRELRRGADIGLVDAGAEAEGRALGSATPSFARLRSYEVGIADRKAGAEFNSTRPAIAMACSPLWPRDTERRPTGADSNRCRQRA